MGASVMLSNCVECQGVLGDKLASAKNLNSRPTKRSARLYSRPLPFPRVRGELGAGVSGLARVWLGGILDASLRSE
jgi:hypothetical protein